MDISTIVVFIVLLALSAFFSWTEIALMSLPKHKIETFIKQNLSGAKDLKYLKENSDKLLITILIWNNLVNTYTAAFATTIAMNVAQNSGLGINQSTAIALATWIVTLLLLLFGEIAPKSFATKNAESISLKVAKFYKFLMTVLYPLVWIIEKITKLFTWSDKTEEVSEEEIQAFIDMWKESWTLENEEHEHLKNILEFSDTVVEEIMTPRVKIDKLSDETIVDEALDFILEHTHSRIPVYHEDVDHIIWIVNVRFLLEEIKKWNWSKKLKDIKLIKPIKVPLNKPIDELLKTFQKAHQHLAIVIDEYGGVAGLVTLEDIVEEVFGEIHDETDKEEEEIKKLWENEYLVNSAVLLEDILDKFNLSVEDLWYDKKDYEWETLSYFITDVLERFPNPGEKIIKDIENADSKLEFVVKDIADAIIWKVSIKKLDKKA